MKVEIEYDYLGVEQVVGILTTRQLIVFQKQIAKVQASYKCNIPGAKDHGCRGLCVQQHNGY